MNFRKQSKQRKKIFNPEWSIYYVADEARKDRKKVRYENKLNKRKKRSI